MPSSSDRRRLEVPAYLHQRLAEIAIAENRTVSSVAQEILTLGLSHYQPLQGDETGSNRFSEEAARALALAGEEAARFNHNYIGTEHLLLGLIGESSGAAARILANYGIGLQEAREYVSYYIGRGTGRMARHPPYVPRAQRVLRLARDEAARFGSTEVGTEHLLLGLAEVPDGVGARVLASRGVLDAVRQDTLRFLLDRVPPAHAHRTSAAQPEHNPETTP